MSLGRSKFPDIGRFLLRVLRKVPPKNSSNISISGRGVHVVVVKKHHWYYKMGKGSFLEGSIFYGNRDGSFGVDLPLQMTQLLCSSVSQEYPP